LENPPGFPQAHSLYDELFGLDFLIEAPLHPHSFTFAPLLLETGLAITAGTFVVLHRALHPAEEWCRLSPTIPGTGKLRKRGVITCFSKVVSVIA
jgi:hypothetical protein